MPIVNKCVSVDFTRIESDFGRTGLTGLGKHRGGLFGHSVAHENFLWQIRLEQNVIDAFAKCWGTDELIVSFDGGNLSLPGPMQNYGVCPHPYPSLYPVRHVGSGQASKWAHVDQQPLKKGIRSIQGIVNLNDNVRLFIFFGVYLQFQLLSSYPGPRRWRFDRATWISQVLRWFL